MIVLIHMANGRCPCEPRAYPVVTPDRRVRRVFAHALHPEAGPGARLEQIAQVADQVVRLRWGLA